MAASRDNELIVADDTDSAISVPFSDSLASLRSSVLQHQIENGRTYHGMSSGKYAYPNDSSENERLEVQHNVWLLTLDGALALCPKGDQGAKRVLDLGTGTGCWAIDYADAHPESEVIGVDLSPIQPSLVPPNCSFELDDVEKDWTWSKPFDFIFSRVMAGSFTDYQAYIDKAYAALEPGGWLEMHDLVLPFISEDGTLDPNCELGRLGYMFLETSSTLGRPLGVPLEYKSMMEKAGFVGVVERHFKWPLNSWPLDPHYKEIGAWTLINLDGGLEGLTLALFTRALGWSKEQTIVYCAVAKKQLRDRRIHSILPTIVVYGQKPALPQGPASESPEAAVESPEPTHESPGPAAESSAPAAESPAPAVESPAPAVESPAPAVESSVPAVESSVPAVESSVPAVESSVPAVESSAPDIESSAPVKGSSSKPAKDPPAAS